MRHRGRLAGQGLMVLLIAVIGLMSAVGQRAAYAAGRAGPAAIDSASGWQCFRHKTALESGDAATAYKLAAQAYRSTQIPDALYVLGLVALSGKNLLAAQDLLRRYLADPNLEVKSDAPELLAAQNIVSRPRLRRRSSTSWAIAAC